MWFLIKGSMYFGLGLVALSYFGAHDGEDGKGQPLDMGSAIAAATGAYDYVSSICVEKPDVCVKGAETFTALGFRAKEGARVAFQFLDTQLSDEGDAKNDAGTGAGTAGLTRDGARPATVSQVSAPNLAPALAPAPAQPMPEKIAAAEQMQVADRVFTGTVINVPVPVRRPLH